MSGDEKCAEEYLLALHPGSITKPTISERQNEIYNTMEVKRHDFTKAMSHWEVRLYKLYGQ